MGIRDAILKAAAARSAAPPTTGLYRCTVCRVVSSPGTVCPNCGARGAIERFDPPDAPRLSRAEQRRADALRESMGDGDSKPKAPETAVDPSGSKGPARAYRISEVEDSPVDRIACYDAGIDRVVAGGFVRQRTYVLFGPPGCGKSRILLSATTGFCRHGPTIYAVHPDEEDGGDVTRHLHELGYDRREGVKRNLRLMHGEDALDIDDVYSVAEKTKNLSAFVVDSASAISAAYARGRGDAIRYIFASGKAVAKATNSVGFFLMHEREDGKMYGGSFLQHATSGAVLKIYRVKRTFEEGPDETLIAKYVVLPDDELSNFVRLQTTGKNRFGNATQTTIYEHTDDGMIEVR